MTETNIHEKDKKSLHAKKENNKKTLLVIGGVASTLLIIIVVLTLTLNTKNSGNANDKQTQASPSNTASLQDTKQNVPLQSLSAEDKNNAEISLADFNSKPFDPETEKPSERFTLFKIRQGQKYRMTVNYSNIGDESMKKGSVLIKLGDGLSLVKNSMKEEISGKEAININDTNLYDSTKNVIQYGPGSTDKNFSQVMAGDAGKIIFDVEMATTKAVGENSRIYSYLSDEGDSKGKIDLVFFEVTPKN